jgi:hypothetical protein
MQSRPGDLQLKDPTTLIFVPALLHPTDTHLSGTARRAKGRSKLPACIQQVTRCRTYWDISCLCLLKPARATVTSMSNI